jgi:hypothetical protein
MALNFPDSPTLNQVYSAGGKTWSYNGSRWVLVIATAIIDVADGSITAAKIADGTIVAAEIANSAITTAKILDANVTAAKIAADAVTTAKIADANVTASKIASDAVTTAKILDSNVTTAKILDANVTTAKVAANAITQAKLASNLSAVTVTTTANRDTDIPTPFTGQLAVLTDTRKIQLYDGTSWVNVSLAPPETPTSLSATALGTTSVSVAFTAGGANGSPITNYKYALSTNGGSTYGSFTALDPADATTPITISGLTAATTYYIKLKAVNDLGDSVASSAVSIGTLSTPDAPTSLSAGSITTTSVAISFTPGSDNGFAITNYQYALSTNGGSTYGSFTALDPTDATSPITISGLTADTSYYVKLKAVNSSGTGAESSAVSFSTNPLLVVNYLVVAGGGGGGTGYYAGGGGAGGLRSTVTATGGGGSLESALSPSLSTNYTVTVGAGGGGGPDVTTAGVNGSNSVFSTITSVGGGGAVSRSQNVTGATGGSGGGVSYLGSPGSGTANQGFAGGTGAYGGSGGGAGAVGNSGTGNNILGGYYGSPGAIGVATTISGSSVYYAGGGAAGSTDNPGNAVMAGGQGGGGAGGLSGLVLASSGTTNTGGGGGGAGGPQDTAFSYGAAGGSGVVILRYPSAYTITIGAGLTGSTANVSSNKVTTITSGSGNVSWA